MEKDDGRAQQLVAQLISGVQAVLLKSLVGHYPCQTAETTRKIFAFGGTCG
jgi:hypothetical protein